MKKIHITELVLRDGHQCQIATRLRTEDMLPICPQLDALGFWSIEAWGGATFDACVRFLKEDPWERLKLLRKALPNSRIQMLLRGQNLLGYRHYSDDVVEAFVKQSANNGVDVFRIFDAMNDVRNLTTSIKAVKKYKKHAEGTLSYTTSPVHDIPYFVSLAKPNGINTEGLKRRGFDPKIIAKIKEAYKILYRQGLSLKESQEKIKLLSKDAEALNLYIDFIAKSTRGIIR